MSSEPIERCAGCGAYIYKSRDCDVCAKLDDPLGWMELAACKGIDTEVFFPERIPGRNDPAERMYQNDISIALRICAKCPVRGECLDYGLEDDYGIFGGLMPHQRKIIRTKQTRRKGYLR